VADAELIRRRLCGDTPWETLGQSYGGFITLTYLSQAPEGLRACYVTGGLPGITATADDVYARTYPRVRDRVLDFYARYPEDAPRLRKLADHLATGDVRLPNGDRLSPHRLRTLGLVLGMGDGFERLHWLLDETLDPDSAPTDTFLHQAMTLTGFTDNPLFAVLQETLYGQGAGPTGWAAARALADFPEFAEEADPLLLTGEMIYPWMFREIAGRRPFADAADLLAARTDWPPSTTRTASPPTRSPWPRSSTTTTCTSTRASRCARHARSAPPASGSPTSGSTTASRPPAAASSPA
jgi:hypothetical protein